MKTDLLSFSQKYKDKKIICFGAGMIPLCVENLFNQIGIWKNIVCFIDNDHQKSGNYIGTKKDKIIVSIQEYLKDIHLKENIFLITCETYVPVIEQLKNVEQLKDTECYIYAQLNCEYAKQQRNEIVLKKYQYNKIPKVIHTCWFGKADMNELNKKCIESWKKICPDYEIKIWNESNYDIRKNRYMREAYDAKKWAFVSDYARLDILYNEGGIYFDTDVELIKRPDGLLGQSAFISFGEWATVNSGAAIGCIKGHPIIKEMRDNPRAVSSFYNPDGTYNMTINSIYETKALEKYGFKPNFKSQYVEDVLVLSPDYFAVESVVDRYGFKSSNTIGIHYQEGSWAGEKRKREMDIIRREKF